MAHRALPSTLTLALVLTGALTAREARADTVFLRDGGRVRGVVMEEVPKKGVRVKLLDGTVREVPAKDVERVAYDDEQAPTKPAATKAPAPPPAEAKAAPSPRPEGAETTSRGPTTGSLERAPVAQLDVVELQDGTLLTGTILSVTTRGVVLRLGDGAERLLMGGEVRAVRYAKQEAAQLEAPYSGAPAYQPPHEPLPSEPVLRRKSMPMAIAGLSMMPLGLAGVGGWAVAWLQTGLSSNGNSGRDTFAVGMGVSVAVLAAGAVLTGVGLRKVPTQPTMSRGFDPSTLSLRF